MIRDTKTNRLVLFLLFFSGNFVAYIPNVGLYMFAAITFFCAFLALVGNANRKGLPAAPAGLPILATCFFLSVSAFWATEQSRSVQNISWIIVLTLSCYIAYMCLYWSRNTTTVQLALTASILALLTFSAVEFGADIFQGGRLEPLGINANLFARTVIFGMVLICASMIARQELSISKIGILAFLVILVVYGTGSRKGLFLVFLILALFGYHHIKTIDASRKILFIFLAILSLSYFFMELQTTQVWERSIGMAGSSTIDGGGEASFVKRLTFAGRGLELFAQKPMLGWGLHQFQYVSGFRTYSHSNYIELLVNNGLIGFCIYYSIYAAIFFEYRRVKKIMSEQNRFLFVSLFSTTLAWDVAAVSYQTSSTWLFIALLCYLVREPRLH